MMERVLLLNLYNMGKLLIKIIKISKKEIDRARKEQEEIIKQKDFDPEKLKNIIKI